MVADANNKIFKKMKRKLIIVASIIAAVAIIFAIFLKFFVSNENQEIKNENQASTSLPVVPSQDNTIRVQDESNQNQIKESFEKYISQNVNDYPSYEKIGISKAYSMSDKNGKLINLNSFLKSVGATINPKIKNLVGTNYYGFFYCPDEKGGKNFGVTFELGNSDPQKLGSVNSEAKEAMRQWEPYMLKDLRTILFPEKNFSEEQINQTLVFKEGKFRYAEVVLPGGEKSSINYVVDIYPPNHSSSVNNVYISTSKDCLQRSTEALFDF